MMKIRSILSVAVVAAMSGAVATSCGNSAKSEKNAGKADNIIEFETYDDELGFVAPNFIEGDSVYAAVKYSIVWPEKIGQQDFRAMRDSLMTVTFGNDNAETFTQATGDFVQRSLEDFFGDMNGNMPEYEKTSYAQAYDAAGNNVQTLNSEVTLLNTNLLVIRATNYTYYYHAAHGMTTVAFLNYSLADHLVLNPSNFFTAGTDTAILDLINAAAKEKYYEEGALFDRPITTFSNFQVTENDVVFVYQPYEVGPYSSGVIEVPVSQYDLYRFLTPEARKAMGINEN